jgi:ubiquinone/menaquinone biosynthesis C-methylase UbiE
MLDRAGHADVGYPSGDASGELPFQEASFDVALLAAVLGEVPDKSACIRSLARVLRPGGLLVFVEAFPDPDRLSPSTLRKLAEPNGFAFESCVGTTRRDIVRFRRLPSLNEA